MTEGKTKTKSVAYTLKDLEFNWVNLAKPDLRLKEKYGKEAWSLQAAVYSRDRADEIEEETGVIFKPLREDPKNKKSKILKWVKNFQAYTHRKDGTENKPIPVKDGYLQPINPALIGNGSIGNLRFKVRENPASPTGISIDLIALQIKKLIVRDPGDIIDENEGFDTDSETEIIGSKSLSEENTNKTDSLEEEDDDDVKY
jgi:hypothetical protein